MKNKLKAAVAVSSMFLGACSASIKTTGETRTGAAASVAVTQEPMPAKPAEKTTPAANTAVEKAAPAPLAPITSPEQLDACPLLSYEKAKKIVENCSDRPEIQSKIREVTDGGKKSDLISFYDEGQADKGFLPLCSASVKGSHLMSIEYNLRAEKNGEQVTLRGTFVPNPADVCGPLIVSGETTDRQKIVSNNGDAEGECRLRRDGGRQEWDAAKCGDATEAAKQQGVRVLPKLVPPGSTSRR